MGDGPCVHGVTFMRDCPRCTALGDERETSARWGAVKGALGFLLGSLAAAGLYAWGYWDGVAHNANRALGMLFIGGLGAIVVLVVLLWRAAR